MFPIVLPQLALTFPNLDPILFQIGPIAIRWYSLSYIVGIVLGWLYAKSIVRNNRLWGRQSPITDVDMDDFMLWATIGTVLGGRFGYVFFYDFAGFMADPVSIFQIWQGGMSFHGGFLGVTIAMILFARARKTPVWSLFDVIATVVPIGLGLGRVANFINGELWGRVSDAPWAMAFPTGGPQPRHPSQLYEAALEGALLLAVLFIAVYGFKALHRPRLATGIFVGGYGIARTIVEFFREPDAHLGYLFGDWFTMGMLLSMPMVLIGLALILSARKVEYLAPETDHA
ncbi:prolipoprotein diacylglyceryl transferase [Ahrensia sp. 13_GOM-1096m]|uniref:prolipoprotein diacylglyceryl transferase n=1 Tax=Ahrensia sp. 13_GOM-1096m TaxID=1380380 RepID=UPI00047D3CCF|nr:prolipoprotein diacylglyceryl transferase [Ahrensia sp. 13_GOM-1096m]